MHVDLQFLPVVTTGWVAFDYLSGNTSVVISTWISFMHLHYAGNPGLNYQIHTYTSGANLLQYQSDNGWGTGTNRVN